jgi:hypothetical protein
MAQRTQPPPCKPREPARLTATLAKNNGPVKGQADQGGVVLEKPLNTDGEGYRGAHIDCGTGHKAKFVDYRSKEVLTAFAPVQVQRAYDHCADCGSGVISRRTKSSISRETRQAAMAAGSSAFSPSRSAPRASAVW